MLQALALAVLDEVLSFVGRRGGVSRASRALREAVSRVDVRAEALDVSAVAAVADPHALAPLVLRFAGLQALALGAQARDGHLGLLTDAALPHLRSLDASNSRVTDAGLEALSYHRRRRGLAELNLVMCERTTFVGTLLLRRRLAVTAGARCAVWRLPRWLVGAFETPWGETHVYYADGSFDFDRSEQATGYVIALTRCPLGPSPAGAGARGPEDEVLADSLQYVDFSLPLPPAWPRYFQAAYRPGVLARRPAPDGGPPSVLIAQKLRALAAPRAVPAELPWAAARLGERIYSRGAAWSLDQGDAAFGAAGAEFMISRMAVTPIVDTQPPERLLARIDAFHAEQPAHTPAEARRLTELLEHQLNL